MVASSPAAAHESLADVLASIEKPAGGSDPAAERRRRAQRLIAVVGGDRNLLEPARSAFLRRLHRASGDLGATAGLRVVEAAMSLTPIATKDP
jgi:hypothetical protein